MIPVEIGEPSLRRQTYGEHADKESLYTSIDITTKLRERAKIRNIVAKQRAARKYNSKLQPQAFLKGNLIWRMASNARKKEGRKDGD